MTDKQIIKQLAERYKEICRSPFADGYTFTAFDGECAKKGFTRDDIKNYIEKEKQERKAKRTESIKSLKEQLKAKEQECEELKNFHINLVGVKECEIKELTELKAENKHLNDLLNQALKDYDKARQTLTEIKEIVFPKNRLIITDCSIILKTQEKISECEVE